MMVTDYIMYHNKRKKQCISQFIASTYSTQRLTPYTSSTGEKNTS